MHKWERGDQNWNEKTHLNPSANHIHREIEFIRFLKKGISIKRRSYDHTSGKFTIPSKIKSKRVIIYEGLHPFYLSDMKNSFDISFFIQPDEELRRKWKIERDTKERGYSKEKILNQLKDREKDSLEYIQSQSEKADVLVGLKQPNEDGETLILNLKINSNLDLESLLSELNNLKEFNFDYNLDHLFHYLVFYNRIDAKKVEEIAHNLVPEIDELLSVVPIWENDFNGILQLVQIACVQSKLTNE
jgi:uridine kinase